MCTVLGFDISSRCTGWAFVNTNDTILLDYGEIAPTAKMHDQKRLYFFGNEIEKVIQNKLPNKIIAEEVIMYRGVSSMRMLARFQGVAIYKAFCYNKEIVATTEPSKWKKALGLSGSAEKCEVQLIVCKIYKLLDESSVIIYQQKIDDVKVFASECRKAARVDKKRARELKRDYKKKFEVISTDIYSESGISADIGDAIGIATSIIMENDNG